MGTRTGTYYTGNMDGTAGSLITALDAILVTGEGWTKTYSGTNKAVYTQAGGNGFVLRVVDDGSLAAGAREAFIRGAESATGIDTLVDAFPSTAQVADANIVWRKSDTADSTSRAYHAVADDRTLVLTVKHGTNSWDCYIFGDIETYWTGDAYATMVHYRPTANNPTAGQGFTTAVGLLDDVVSGNVWFARLAAGTTKIERGALLRNLSQFGSANTVDVANYPHPETLKLHTMPVRVKANGTALTTVGPGLMARGVVPFLFEVIHGNTFASAAVADTYTDSAYDASSQFTIFSATNNLAASGAKWALQTAGTWDVGV